MKQLKILHMSDNGHQNHSWLMEFGTFLIGVLMGIASKLATIAKERNLKLRDVAINSTIALSAAYVVWEVLYPLGNIKFAMASSVLCGRFADDVLKLAWRILKQSLINAADEAEKTPD